MVLFLIGPPGSGKTHFIYGLRRCFYEIVYFDDVNASSFDDLIPRLPIGDGKLIVVCLTPDFCTRNEAWKLLRAACIKLSEVTVVQVLETVEAGHYLES